MNVTNTELTYAPLMHFMKTSVEETVREVFSELVYDAEVSLSFTNLKIRIYDKHSELEYTEDLDYDITEIGHLDKISVYLLDILSQAVLKNKEYRLGQVITAYLPFVKFFTDYQEEACSLHIRANVGVFNLHKYVPRNRLFNEDSAKVIGEEIVDAFKIAYNDHLLEASMLINNYKW